MPEQNAVLMELKAIRKDVEYIKEHLAHADAILTDDDREAVRTAERELKDKKTARLV